VLPALTPQAIILAGGLGTRLRSTIGDTPKVMAPVAGRPFLEHVLADLDAHGFRRAVLAVGFRREVVVGHFGASFRGLSLSYSEEEQPLGTGGAVRRALALTDGGPCFVLNGDTWLELDHAGMLRAHLERRARLSIAVRMVPDVARYGALELAGERIVRFHEKGRSGPGAINGGAYLLDRALLEPYDLPEAFSLETDFFVPHVASLAPLAFVTGGRFIDIGVPEDYRRAQEMLAAERPA
jgi:D-glycero-alpha-D-manno-heptose 1-phosphate guanylyltransferase